MFAIVEDSFKSGIRFDPFTHRANLWTPRPKDCADIVVDPKISHGQPIIRNKGVPTSVIAQSLKCEVSSFEQVTELWPVTRDEAEQAVRFEKALAA